MQTQRQAPTRRVRPTTPADLWRLAEQGAQNGVAILSESASGERFATSASEPGTIHRLTAHGCSCKGFTYAGRCQHHSLLLAQLGWLPDPEPPTPPAPAVAPSRRMTFGLSPEEVVVLRGQAARLHAERGEPLVDVETGELLAA
jgi:hypothetical protein